MDGCMVACLHGYMDAYMDGYINAYKDAYMDGYNEAVHRDPLSEWAYNLRGNAHRRLGQYYLAIKDYDEAIRLAPQFADSYAGRAFAYTHLTRDQEARQDAERAAELGFDSILLEREIEELTKRR